jgi:sn-glycerol 3-phosphate transport system substrate-binding protein
VQWATGTGYIPIVKKAASSAAVKSFWVQNPGYAVAYEQLLAGVTSPSTAGTVIGPYKDVIDALRNAENSMVLEGKSPAAAVKAAAADATAAILDYNDRIGF